jgi:hypothetical protein
MTLEFFDNFSKNPPISNFMKIRLAGAELFHANREIDITKLIVVFRSFANAPKKDDSDNDEKYEKNDDGKDGYNYGDYGDDHGHDVSNGDDECDNSNGGEIVVILTTKTVIMLKKELIITIKMRTKTAVRAKELF